jgi:UDP-glucuronate 4-epimerase
LKKILVTGAAGFIGFHLTLKLLARGEYVFGIDNMNEYYDVNLKELRLKKINEHENAHNFHFVKIDISNSRKMLDLFENNTFDVVINLAAQAGVRYSIKNPQVYANSNLIGFLNVLEGCRHQQVKHLIYASSSSVYGRNAKQPFSVHDRSDYPISLYAATKKSNELMAHAYSNLYKLPTTGLRFFTVYGPYGRPDMAYYSFTRNILNGTKIKVFNNGDLKRDFTYIDDIVDGVIGSMNKIPSAHYDEGTNSSVPYSIYNIGNNNPITLRRFISAIESACGVKANEVFLPMQAGDVPVTFADIDSSINDLSFRPKIQIEEGINRFVGWYQEWNDYFQN